MKIRKSIALILAVLMLALTLAGCGGTAEKPADNEEPVVSPEPAPEKEPEPSSEPEPSPEPVDTKVTFTDLQGNVIELDAPAKTIASGKANLTQITLILAGESAVATAGQGVDTSDGSLMNDMFPGIKNLEVVSEGEINIETLLNVNPDVMLVYGNAPETDLSKQLKESGLTVAICNLANEEELLSTMKFLSDALGDDAKAVCKEYEDFYRGIMADVAAKSADIADEDKPNVAYIRGNGAVCGVNSMPQNWITAAGGKNIGELAGIEQYAAEMTAEEFLNFNPDIIFCEAPSSLEFLAKDEYKNVKAVVDGAVYVVPRGLSCSGLANAENPLVWQWAANIIQPEVYSYDAEKTVLDFFKNFYKYELTDAQLELVMYPAGK